MNLGDVREKSVPKMMLVAPPRAGVAVCVRSFIPHRAHATIGVLGAVSVATACLVQGSPASEVAVIPPGKRQTLPVAPPPARNSILTGQSVSVRVSLGGRRIINNKKNI